MPRLELPPPLVVLEVPLLPNRRRTKIKQRLTSRRLPRRPKRRLRRPRRRPLSQLKSPRRMPRLLLRRARMMPRKLLRKQQTKLLLLPLPQLLLHPPLHPLLHPLPPQLLHPQHQHSEQQNIDNGQQRVIYNRVEWCSRIAVMKPQALTIRPGTVSTAPAIIMIGKQSNDIC